MFLFYLYKQTRWLITLFALLPLLLACSDESREMPEVMPDPYGYKAPLPEFELKREVYGDPDSFDMPRIQFMWQGPKRGKKEIWSIKIDGSDLRLAVDKELLYSGDTHDMNMPRYPTRSPDNRYILTQFSKPGRAAQIYLIDLKEQRKKFLTECQIGDAPWTGDSNSFFCNFYQNLKRYYIDSNTFEILEEFDFGIYYVQQNAEKIYQMTEEGFIVWDFQGHQIRKETIGKLSKTNHYINANAQYIIYRDLNQKEYNKKIARIESPKTTIAQFRGADLIAQHSETVFSGNSFSIKRCDIDTKQCKIVYKKYGGRKYNHDVGMQLNAFTLFNEGLYNGMYKAGRSGKTNKN